MLREEGVIDQTNIVILRPGMVWHPNQRKWAFPLKIATDIGYKFNKEVVQKTPYGSMAQGVFPQASSINLSRLTDFAIQGALGNLEAS